MDTFCFVLFFEPNTAAAHCASVQNNTAEGRSARANKEDGELIRSRAVPAAFLMSLKESAEINRVMMASYGRYSCTVQKNAERRVACFVFRPCLCAVLTIIVRRRPPKARRPC